MFEHTCEGRLAALFVKSRLAVKWMGLIINSIDRDRLA